MERIFKTPEDIINKFINEESVKFNQERDDWMIEAIEEYGKQQYNQAIINVFNKIGDIAELILKLKK